MSNKIITPFDDSINSIANDSGGDEVPYDRTMVIGELLALEFDDDQPYTRAELDKMNDDQLIDLYNSEMFSDSGGDLSPDEEVECSICGVTKVCEFESDEEEPICADCESEESDDSPGDDDVEEVESEIDEEEEGDEDDIDETEEA